MAVKHGLYLKRRSNANEGDDLHLRDTISSRAATPSANLDFVLPFLS